MKQAPASLLGLLSLAITLTSCDTVKQDSNYVNYKEDALVIQRVESLVGNLSSQNKNQTEEGIIIPVFSKTDRPTIVFQSSTQYKRAVMALDAIGYFENLNVSIHDNLRIYVDSSYLSSTELSFFDHNGNIMISDTLYHISGDFIELKKNNALISRHHIWENIYNDEAASKTSETIDIGYSYISNAYSSYDGLTYESRIFAYNRSYNTGPPFWAEKASAGTVMQIRDPNSNQWVLEVSESRFPDTRTKVSMQTKRAVWFDCVTRTHTSEGITRTSVSSGRCNNQGVTSKHTASINSVGVFWESGEYPELNLQ